MRLEPGRREYERWVEVYGGELYRYARGLMGESGRGGGVGGGIGGGGGAEDLLQETFVEAWRCRGSLRDPGHARAWLFQIMRHRYARLVRKKRVERGAVAWEVGGDEAAGVGGEPAALGEGALEGLARRDELEASLARLSPEIRKTFLMVFLEQLTCRETAAELGIPVGTVLSRLDAARRKLRAFMTREEPVGGERTRGDDGVRGERGGRGESGAGGSGASASAPPGGRSVRPAGTRAVTPETGRTP